ncbi:FAD-dependent oxidoreductase [Sutterella sp.]|uniref:FAD-dependent oxidoreductase n=1 Tax=Sutterella sp. TaxID=1981025 RepID=UPI0026E07AD5|nr:FAD-dependent oxidoreductase [Sutterella sp.]MDO5531546.1 FAD-dependent oxidoreductase [Sutterella sp.]
MQFSRRKFITGSAAGAAAGLFGASAFAAPTPSLRPLPASWDMTTDVVVCGSGIAGMSAATAAVDNGASVLVFEKDVNYGGAAIINGGIIALRGGTRFQREAGEKDTPEALYAHLTNPLNAEYRKNDPRLAKKYSEYCGGTQEWLEERGVKFMSTFTKSGQYDSQHKESYLHIWTDNPGDSNAKPQPTGGYRCGRGIMVPLRAYCEKKGVKLFFEHKVTDVYRDADGNCVGCRVEAAGKVINVRAKKGVILAGGSFKNNRKMRWLVDPRLAGENIYATGYPHYDGDGSAIIAGLRAGAMYEGDRGEDTAHLRRKFGTTRYNFPKGSKYGCPGIAVAGPRWGDTIFTNRDGRRFVREEDVSDLGGYNFYDMALVQPEQKLWCVFDDRVAKKNRWDTTQPQCEEGYAFTAATIEELAKVTNQPELPAQVERFNKFVEAGKDDEFDRPAKLLKRKIEQGPFHAVRIIIFAHNFTGGLAIDENARVHDIEGNVIPGLYAAGETAGGLYVGNGMPRGIMPGRFAGEHAAQRKA